MNILKHVVIALAIATLGVAHSQEKTTVNTTVEESTAVDYREAERAYKAARRAIVKQLRAELSAAKKLERDSRAAAKKAKKTIANIKAKIKKFGGKVGSRKNRSTRR